MKLPAAYHAIKNARHKEFVRLVAVEGCSDIEAYVKAGYSELSARQNACRLRENEGIQAAIDATQDLMLSNSILSREKAMEILTKIAKQDAGQYLSDDGEFDLIKARDDGYRMILGARGLTGESPKQAIEALAKMNGWNKPVVQKVDHNVTGVIGHVHASVAEVAEIIKLMTPDQLAAELAKRLEIVIPSEDNQETEQTNKRS